MTIYMYIWSYIHVEVHVYGIHDAYAVSNTLSCQARASLGEWLKELSLFNHLLHGLFKYLSDADSSLKSQLEGLVGHANWCGMSVCAVRLCCCTTF